MFLSSSHRISSLKDTSASTSMSFSTNILFRTTFVNLSLHVNETAKILTNISILRFNTLRLKFLPKFKILQFLLKPPTPPPLTLTYLLHLKLTSLPVLLSTTMDSIIISHLSSYSENQVTPVTLEAIRVQAW